MQKQILLNDTDFHFELENLPLLIHGTGGVGASLFTVTLIADLCLRGFKIVFLSGYPMARAELLNQVGESVRVFLADKQIKDADAIFIPGDKPELLLKASTDLTDFHQRVVLIKNIDLFDSKPFDSVRDHPHLILSGDLDKCSYADKIFQTNFASIVIFSNPSKDIEITLPELDKYEGFYKGKNNSSGIVKVAR